MIIGIYDDCGRSTQVIAAIKQAYPEYTVETVSDPDGVALGDIPAGQFLERIEPALRGLAKSTDVLVVPCAVPEPVLRRLRQHIPMPIVALPAAAVGAAALPEKRLMDRLRRVVRDFEISEEQM